MNYLKAISIILLFNLTQCTHNKTEKLHTGESITVMAYNVENLFDTKHDKDKDDFTYLPLKQKKSAFIQSKCNALSKSYWRKACKNKDWSQKHLKIKMERLASVILSDKHIADILVLEEVENIQVLEELRTKYLQAAGYKPAILIEGPDTRGIDTAILSRYPQEGEAQLHEIPFKYEGNKQRRKSRGILEASFRLPDGKIITVFAIHFPAPYNPRYLRVQAFKYLNKLAASASQKGHIVIAAGDFNNSKSEETRYGLYKKTAAKNWYVSNLVGCKKCKGSNYYAKANSWSFLDAIMLYKRKNQYVSIDPESVRIVTTSKTPQINKKGQPIRFSFKKGVSDHLPIALELNKK